MKNWGRGVWEGSGGGQVGRQVGKQVGRHIGRSEGVGKVGTLGVLGGKKVGR